MSRIEAAGKAARYENRREHPTTASRVTAIAVAALAAADAHDAANGVHRLVIDDATVERAAKIYLGLPANEPWPWVHTLPQGPMCITRKIDTMTMVRAVLAAAVKEDGE